MPGKSRADEDDENSPSWMSRDNDHVHHQQHRDSDPSLPLFGTGEVPLEGEVSDSDEASVDDDNIKKSKYGSLDEEKPLISASPARSKASSTASRTSKHSKASKKLTTKSTSSRRKAGRKEKKTPVKSVFDDESEDEASSISSGTARALELKPHVPPRNYALYFFWYIAFVAVVASLGLLATQLLPLFLSPLKTEGVFDVALKAYISFFCVVFIMVEWEAPIPFLRKSQLLQLYFSRGFIHSFIALICLEEAYSERVKDMMQAREDFHVAWASLFMQITSWLMMACGVLYMLMGLCCLQGWRDRMFAKDRELWKKYRKELKQWKQLYA